MKIIGANITGSFTLNGQDITTTVQSSSIWSGSVATQINSLNTFTASAATTGSNTFVGNQTISGSLIPAVNITYDLGSSSNRWKDLYLSGSTIYLGETILSTTTGGIQIKNASGSYQSIIGSSLQISGGAALTMDTASGIIKMLNTGTSSLHMPVEFSGSFSGSFFGTSSLSSQSISASYASNSLTASYASNSLTASYASNSLTASYASNASNALTASYLSNYIPPFPYTGSAAISGSLNVTGNITAQTLIVQTITSSVDFVTGSARFGSISANTHQFTGSVSITGSLNVNGIAAILSSQTSSMTVSAASTATSASYATNASTAASATSATSASYAANGGVTSITAGTGISVNQSTGAVTITNSITNTNQLTNGAGFITNTPSYLGISNTSSTTGYGISLYNGGGNGEMSYGLFFGGTATFGAHGAVAGNDWATYFTMNNVTTRGWIFRRAGAANVASISSGGVAYFDGSVRTPIYYDSNDTAKYLTRNTDSYTSWYMGGANNGYSGWNVDGGMKLMMHTNGNGGPCGFYHTSAGWAGLFYTNGSQYLYYNASEKFSTQSYGIYVTGEIRATSDITAYYSDARLKKDVDVITNAVDKIKQLRGVTYTWNEEEVNIVKKRAGQRDIGLIAQEVEAVEPLLTKEYQTPLDDAPKTPDEASNHTPRMSETYKTIKYDKLVALLVEAVKEQQAQIDDLKNIINELTR